LKHHALAVKKLHKIKENDTIEHEGREEREREREKQRKN